MPAFDHSAFRQALHALGLSDTDAATMLGCEPNHIRRMKQNPADTAQARPVKAGTARLLQAYLEGYRPNDWPIPRSP